MKTKIMVYVYIILSIHTNHLYAQDGKGYIHSYYPFIYEAESAYLDSKFDVSIENYKKAFVNNEPLRFHLVWAAKVCAAYKDYPLMQEYLTLAFQKGATYSKVEKVIRQENKSALKSPEWEQVKLKYTGLHNSYLQKLPTELTDRVELLLENDQMYRGGGIKKKRANWHLQRKKDSLNIIDLIEIIQEYGFPYDKVMLVSPKIEDYTLYYFHKVTPFTEAGTYLVVHHNSLNTKLMEVVKNEVDKGNCPPEFYGIASDYHKAVFGNTVFGHYVESMPLKIIDYANLDQRRQAVGLEKYELFIRKVSLKKKIHPFEKL